MICYARKKYLLKVLAKKNFFTERRQVKSTGNDSFLKVQLGAVIERCSTRIVIGETYSEPNQMHIWLSSKFQKNYGTISKAESSHSHNFRFSLYKK